MRKSDLSTFFENLAAVRPTVMLLIPRLANMMYDKLVGQLEQAPEGSEDAKAAYGPRCAHSLAAEVCQSQAGLCGMGMEPFWKHGNH